MPQAELNSGRQGQNHQQRQVDNRRESNEAQYIKDTEQSQDGKSESKRSSVIYKEQQKQLQLQLGAQKKLEEQIEQQKEQQELLKLEAERKIKEMQDLLQIQIRNEVNQKIREREEQYDKEKQELN